MKLLVLTTALTMAASQATAETEITIYGDDSYPPYSFFENGQMTGIYTKVLEAVDQKMPDYRFNIKKVPWKRGLADIEKGNIFALYPPYKREEARPYMEYDMGILDEEVTLFCNSQVAAENKPNWPEDYYGLTIGNNSGFAAGGEAFLAAGKAGKLKIEETKGTPNNLKKLIGGRVDCYLNDGLSIEWELKKLNASGHYSGAGVEKAVVIAGEQGYLGVVSDGSKFPYKEDFKTKYHAVLKAMKDSGEVDQIIKDFVK